MSMFCANSKGCEPLVNDVPLNLSLPDGSSGAACWHDISCNALPHPGGAFYFAIYQYLFATIHAELKITPGFMMPLGSSASLIARIAASRAGSP